MESTPQTTKFFCAFCKEYQLISNFQGHRMAHHNEIVPYPETLEQLKQRFEMLGLYDEQ